VRAPLSTRLAAEFLGTGLLVASVVGSGAMAQRLTEDIAVQLLANSLATVGALTTLIWMFGPISGAHFNPVVTLSRCVLDRFSWTEAGPYLLTQTLGGIGGAALANAMFDLPLLGPSTTTRDGGGILLGEVVATVTLLMVIHLIGKSNPRLVPVAVGMWIGGAYWFTSSTSLANPAVTIARSFTESFAGIAPTSVPMFVLVQMVSLLVALPVLALFTRRSGR
jgi:arsenate reductase